MPTDDSTPRRCRHEMTVGQCAICGESRSDRASQPSTAPRPSVLALVRALRAQHRGWRGSKGKRRALASRVRAAEASLTKAERREAHRIVNGELDAAAARRADRIREDKLAGIYRPFISPENVGRGRRS